MGSKAIFVAISLISLVVLAGCAGQEGGKTSTVGARGFKAAHDATTGSITGFVLDDSLLPIGDAKVSLLTADGRASYADLTTDTDGAFSFSYVPAGTYKIEAKAAGYDLGVIDVTVAAGEVFSDASFYLAAAFADVAYFITDSISRMVGGGTAKWSFECGQTPFYYNNIPVPNGEKYCVGGNTCVQQLGCENESTGSSCYGSYSSEELPEGEENEYGGSHYRGGYRDLLRNNTDWQTQLAEVTWTASSSVSGRGVLFEILGPNVTNGNGGHTSRCGGINQSDPRDFLVVSDQAPVRIEINDDLLAARGVTEDDRCCDWRFRVFPGWCDLGNCERWGPDANAAGVVAPTKLDIYYSIFFKERPPPGWTILPD